MPLDQITLRGIPAEIEKIVRKEAERQGLSLNKAFILLLKNATGMKAKGQKTKHLYHELDQFSGLWSKEEAAVFEKNLEFQRRIDKTIWKKTG